MKRLLCSTLTMIAVSAAGAAVAADAPAPAPVHKSVAVAQPTWAGGYVGIQGGWGWGDTRHFNSGFNSSTFDVEGGLIGITTGYNWQQGSWVFGYESDTSYSGIDGTKSTSPCGTPCDTELRWLSTYRLRLGNGTPQYLPYITGGAAVGTARGTRGGSDTLIGWTAGAGIEGVIAPNWTAKLEYLYVDFGDELKYTIFGNRTKVELDAHIVRVGLNYKFSFWDWLLQKR